MDKLNVIVCVDDTHPEEGYGCPDDTQTHLLNELNKEYGVQFTLFAPTNYHSKYPLSETTKTFSPSIIGVFFDPILFLQLRYPLFEL